MNQIEISIDATNPGQYFACCGLLELAHRHWGTAAKGCFTHEGTFVLEYPENLTDEELKKRLVDSIEIKNENTTAESPLFFLFDPHKPNIYLHWWFVSPAYKTWAGQQTSYGIIQELCEKAKNIPNLTEGFQFVANMSGRLSFDCRSNWTGQNAGFSPNDQKMKVASYPFVELLAALGFQRFHPIRKRDKGEDAKYTYAIWLNKPLDILNACVAHTTIYPSFLQYYEFLIQKSGNYKYFTRSILKTD